MFSQTFVEGGPHTRKPYTIALSLLLQIAAICLLILIPLLYTQVLPGAQLKSMLMAPPPPPPPPRPPVVAKTHPAVVTRTLQTTRLVAPSAIPKHIAMISEAPAALDIGSTGAQGDLTGVANPLLFASSGPGVQPAPPPPIVAPKRSGPVRVGGVVAEANIVRKVQPVYPPLAKSARVQGTVEFSATISKEGRVENLQLLRGHPLLVNAARDAILQWQYRPTLLNGQPVEVLTTITVNFTLSE